MRAAALAICLLLCCAAQARAESLIIAFSNDHIAIDSNFTGADLTLFGSIEAREPPPMKAGSYDLVIIASGPFGSVKVRKKEATGPFWFNQEQAIFPSIPSYLAILSNRPIDSFIDARTQALFATSLEAQLTRLSPRDTDAAFKESLIHLRSEQQLFAEESGTIEFLSPSLFRATIHLPGSAPLGRYDVLVFAFAGGRNVATQAAGFHVNRGGIEHSLAVAANQHGILYGLFVIAMALVFGWLASVIFRRD